MCLLTQKYSLQVYTSLNNCNLTINTQHVNWWVQNKDQILNGRAWMTNSHQFPKRIVFTTSVSLELCSCHSSTKAFCNMNCKCQPRKSSIRPWTETYCKRLGPCRCLQTWAQSSFCAFAGVLRFSFCLLMSALPQAVTHRCYCHETIWVKSSSGLSANKTLYVCFSVFICVS